MSPAQTSIELAQAGGAYLNATAMLSVPFVPSNGVDMRLNGTLRSSGYEAWTVPCVATGELSATNNSVYACDATLLQKVPPRS